jgi:hypothetical protein
LANHSDIVNLNYITTFPRGASPELYVFSPLLHVECVQLAAAFGSQSSLPIEKQSGSKLHALHMSAQISLSPAKHTLPVSGDTPEHHRKTENLLKTSRETWPNRASIMHLEYSGTLVTAPLLSREVYATVGGRD